MKRAGQLTAAITALMALSVLAACGEEKSETSAAPGDPKEAAAAEPSSDAIEIGYSAWPGWFVWTVTEEQGFFEQEGVKVKLTYFSDYTTSLQAMSAGKLDGNAQTLNDTLLGVATGGPQVSVIENDNSNGNDAIIADASIKTVQDLKGKTVAAEQGVVDHFLLLQGLEAKGMKESDVNFRNLLTDAAAGGFAGGETDAVGVFAPFTLQALERPGSHVLFSSRDFPGTISDHLVVTPELIKERPGDVQKIVNAWYKTLAWMEDHPDEATAIMAAKAEISPQEYIELAEGTRLFSAKDALSAYQGTAATDLGPMAERINGFLVSTGLIPKKASIDGLFDPSFTESYLKTSGG